MHISKPMNGKLHIKRKGEKPGICRRKKSPWGDLGGILFIPCSACFQAALVAANAELVWELGQTCAAARNGI